MNEQKFVDWDGLVYYHEKATKLLENSLTECLKFGGIVVNRNELPPPSFDTLNYTYTVKDEFTSDDYFLKPGQVIPPSTTVQVVEVDGIYKYSVFKEEEANLQPVYQEIESLKSQFDESDAQLDGILQELAQQEIELETVSRNQENTTVEIEELNSTIEELEGTVESIEDQYDRTDERVDELTTTVIAVNNNINSLNNQLEYKANKTDLNGLASETYVQAKIAEAQLSSDGEVDLSVYVTKDEMESKIELIQESIKYGDF